MTGNLTISKSAPEIYLKDTGADGDDFKIRVDSNILSVFADRGDDGTPESPHPLQLNSNTNKAYTFGNEIVTLDSSGNLGVGTSSPSAKLAMLK